jgi:hypothetical protein
VNRTRLSILQYSTSCIVSGVAALGWPVYGYMDRVPYYLVMENAGVLVISLGHDRSNNIGGFLEIKRFVHN